MTQVEMILKFLGDALDFTSTVTQMYDSLKIPRPSIRRVLSVLTKNRILGRVERGTYRLVQIYKEILHTKRIIDTSSNKPIHRYDIDLESTSIGRVPVWVPLRKIERVLNPKLIEATIEQLGREGIFLIDDYVEFKIMGTQWRDQVHPRYSQRHDVTIDMINNSGVPYTFKTHFNVKEDEF